MSLGRILGLCAVPLGLFAVAIGVVLILGPSMVGGIVAAVIGGDLLVAGIWMLVTGRPRTLPFKAARPGIDAGHRLVGIPRPPVGTARPPRGLMPARFSAGRHRGRPPGEGWARGRFR